MVEEIKPVGFPEADTWADSDAANVSGAPVATCHDDYGPLRITCWRFPLIDRLRLLLTGRLYVAAKGARQPALWMRTDRDDVFGETDNG